MLGYVPGAGLPAAADQDGLSDPIPEELPLDPLSFWGGEESLEELLGEVRLPEVHTNAQKVGRLFFWRAFLWEISPEMNYLVASTFGVIGTLGFALFGSNVRLVSSPAPPN